MYRCNCSVVELNVFKEYNYLTMTEETKIKKTPEEVLKAHEDERTKCTVYTRVMGYHRPVETFNAGKQGEFNERQHFVEPGK